MRGFPWRETIRTGLLGSVVALHLSLVGMVEAFSRREIVKDVVTLGQLLLLLVVLVAGYLAARKAAERNKAYAIIAGLIVGLIIGAVLAALALSIKPLHLRQVFTNASRGLVRVLLFDKKGMAGVLTLLAVMGGGGIAAGLLELLPNHVRRPLLYALIATLTLGLLRDIFAVILPRSISRFFYTSSGLTVKGAVVLAVAWTLYFAAAERWGQQVRGRLEALPPEKQKPLRLGAYAIALILLLVLPKLLGERGGYIFEVLDIVGIYIVMGLGLNIVVGFAGLLDLGYVAFFAIGAYTMAVLTTPELPAVRQYIPPMDFWEALPLALLASLLSGIILGVPVLKTRGDYLAIITLGFGEIIRLLVISDALKPILGGAQGITGVARPHLFGWTAKTPQDFFYFILVAIAIGFFISVRLKDSRLGRAWKAIREDEDVAIAMGIDHVATKLTAFATGATLAGLSGAIFSSKLFSIAPHSFNILISIYVLSLLIVGGIGSLPGVVVGAFALVGLPELLREFAEYRMLVYGAALVMMMIFRPQGLWPETLHAEEYARRKGTSTAKTATAGARE
ncbi:MAG: leucine/isoleucine/valine transporter permease subunit [Chloroflexi bacterium]|nr:leucine/isoleucine/valine transporter permease subunit [Chloroflexota bacterium]